MDADFGLDNASMRPAEPAHLTALTLGDLASASGALHDLSPKDFALVSLTRALRLPVSLADEFIHGIAPGRLVRPMKSGPGALVTTNRRVFFVPNSGVGFVCLYRRTINRIYASVSDDRVVLDLGIETEGDWLADQEMQKALGQDPREFVFVSMCLGTGTTPPSLLLKPLERFSRVGQ